MEITTIKKRLHDDLMSSFRTGYRGSKWPEMFKVSDYANDRLTKELGITTDCNETKLGGGTDFAFLVRFDWNCQRWFVGV